MLENFNNAHIANINQDFVWLALYFDGTFDCEYDIKTMQKDINGFYKIKKPSLMEFGLYSKSVQKNYVYFDCSNGVFNVNGEKYTFEYESYDERGIEYFNGTDGIYSYNDIIHYKDATSDANFFNPYEATSITNIEKYNVGYKVKINIGMNEYINSQFILCIPKNEKAYFEIKLTSNVDLNGKINVRRNGNVVDSFDAPLDKNVSGQINWTLK